MQYIAFSTCTPFSFNRVLAERATGDQADTVQAYHDTVDTCCIKEPSEMSLLTPNVAPRSLDQQLAAINQMIYANRYAEAIHEAEGLQQVAAIRLPAAALIALAAALAGERDRAITALGEFPEPSVTDKAEVLLAVGSAWFKR
jgi:hypothetical protein